MKPQEDTFASLDGRGHGTETAFNRGQPSTLLRERRRLVAVGHELIGSLSSSLTFFVMRMLWRSRCFTNDMPANRHPLALNRQRPYGPGRMLDTPLITTDVLPHIQQSFAEALP